MGTESDTEELRALQQKAYGRGGGLTDTEARRLRELEEIAVLAPPAGGAASGEAATAADPASRTDAPLIDRVPSEFRSDAAEPYRAEQEPTGSTSEADAVGVRGSWRQALRAHAALVAAASVLLLLLGIGTGWALFAPRVHDAVSLTADEAQRKVELEEKGDFDEGSLRAVVRDDDALVWFATKNDGTHSCLILDVGDHSQTGCSLRDDVGMFGLNTTLTLPADEGDPDGITGRSVNAYGMMSTSGEPMVAIQRWEDHGGSVVDQFDEELRPRVEELIVDGFDGGLTLAGFVRGEPAWIAHRSADDALEACLIVDALDATACSPQTGAQEDGLRLESSDPDGPSLLVEAGFTNWGTPYLTVTEDVGGAAATVIDTETGDPIEVTSPQGAPAG